MASGQRSGRWPGWRRWRCWPRARCVPYPGVTCRRSEPLYSKSSALRPERDEAVRQRASHPPMQQIRREVTERKLERRNSNSMPDRALIVRIGESNDVYVPRAPNIFLTASQKFINSVSINLYSKTLKITCCKLWVGKHVAKSHHLHSL